MEMEGIRTRPSPDREQHNEFQQHKFIFDRDDEALSHSDSYIDHYPPEEIEVPDIRLNDDMVSESNKTN